MDFDDFVFKDAVIDTQSKVNECNSILAYGYNKGLEYIYGELYPRTDFLWKGRGHIRIFQSLILKSSSVENYPFLSVQNFWHDCIKIQLEQFLKNNGIEFLKDMFQDNEVKKIYLNFSDPWPKTRHEKRRLTSPKFLQNMLDILDGDIEFKTDNRSLFEYSLMEFNRLGLEICELSLNLHEDKPDCITTEYEDKFVSRGNVIYYVRIKQKEQN